MNEKGEHLIRLGLESIGKQAACLKEVYQIDPNSVVMFNPEVFSHNIDKLVEKDPILVAYTTVPEFHKIAVLILIISITAIIISTRKFSVVKY